MHLNDLMLGPFDVVLETNTQVVRTLQSKFSVLQTLVTTYYNGFFVAILICFVQMIVLFYSIQVKYSSGQKRLIPLILKL